MPCIVDEAMAVQLRKTQTEACERKGPESLRAAAPSGGSDATPGLSNILAVSTRWMAAVRGSRSRSSSRSCSSCNNTIIAGPAWHLVR